jgi:hypothetical protein
MATKPNDDPPKPPKPATPLAAISTTHTGTTRGLIGDGLARDILVSLDAADFIISKKPEPAK